MEKGYLQIIARTYQEEMKNVYLKYQEENENIKEHYESEKYQKYVQQTVEQLTKELENQINHFVINVMYNDKEEIYLSRRIEQNKEYYLNYQVPGKRIQ